ncbi:hypothetical protein [Burkholderia stagnalis]|uniref:hypothetical protein n=1 Tax=Burkholderia stagnalis TaxID=1503054 RepID=UPI00075200F2|nr:hypothetical protein [Burkholderia stagnalis]KVX62452.1 hypothetical protein WT33_14070 [Burkholderia stagnalis]
MTPHQKRNAFFREMLDALPEPRTRVRTVPVGLTITPIVAPAPGRVCLSCGSRESGGVLPCGH